MNIVEDKVTNKEKFSKIRITDLFEHAGLVYMKINTIAVEGRGICNAVRLFDGCCYHFGPETEQKIVKHELRIQS